MKKARQLRFTDVTLPQLRVMREALEYLPDSFRRELVTWVEDRDRKRPRVVFEEPVLEEAIRQWRRWLAVEVNRSR